MKPLGTLLCVTCLLLADRVIAIQRQQTPSAPKPRPVAALFEEVILADNAAAVCGRAAKMSDEARFDRLVSWVLPCEDHATIRMTGDFTQTNPAPGNKFDATEEHARGGRIVSPVFDLLDLAKKSDRLVELLQKVDAIPEPGTDEQLRVKTALLTMIHLDLQKNDEAAKATDQLLQLVRNSRPKAVSEMWPETLVVYRHIVRKQTAPGIDEILGFLFSQRTQLDFLPNELNWHTQIASLAGEHGHRESQAPKVSSPEEAELTQWIPISRRRALTRGPGLAASRWGRAGSQVFKISGHDDDYLFFRSPLTGDYEVQCDVTAFTTQTMAAGTFVGNDGDRSHLWMGTFRNSARRVASDLKFSGFDDWIHHRSVVYDGTCTTSLNGLVAHTERAATTLDPWFAVRNWWRLHAAARDIRITGNPVIPETVDLSATEDLRGWYPYYEVSVGTSGAVWEHLPDEKSSGVILGHGGALAGTFCESLLAYQRPLDSVGSMSYEFLYEPGKTEVHPALDRMVLCLQPDGARIHWLTDGSLDRTELGPENLSELQPVETTLSRLPLKPREWNQLTISVNSDRATVHLNGHQICETRIDASNDRVFGLFHFADQTEAKVRNVRMSGSWPKTLPGPKEQEAADKRPEQLDADLVKLSDVFTHDFAKAGVPARFFPAGRNQPGDTLNPGKDGWKIDRPGGGPWFDTFVNLPFMVHGDFDMEIGFEDFKAVGDEYGCIMLVVELSDEKRRQCRILRIRDELQRQELHSSLSQIHQDGGRSFSARPPRKTDAATGRLRMARRGTTLYYLFAENESSVFRVLETEEISDSASVADGLHFHTMCSGEGETSVMWKSISIRAERLTLKPDANAKSLTNLYAMNVDGTDVRLLAEPRPEYIQLGSFEWSADGRKLIGDMSKGGVETSRIVVMNSEGRSIKDLGPGCMPSFSPDNKEIVFSQPSTGIMRMKADGSERKLIDANGWGAQWSPDGLCIAFALGNNVVLLDTKTNKRRQLLTTEQSAQFSYVYWNIGWSQNGNAIAFKARKRDATGFVVAVADADSATGFGVVYDGPDHINEEFTMSPDGRQVLISLKRPTVTTAKLFLVNRDAPGDLRLLPGQPESWDVPGGDWSPDGKTIAFSATTPPATTEWPQE